MDNRQIRDLIEGVVSDVPDGLACYDAYEQGKCDEERRIYRELMAKFPLVVKPAVVPWEDSNIGDVVEVDCEDDGKRLVIPVSCDGMGWPDRCDRCVCGRYAWSCPASIRDNEIELCSTHPSGCDVYFTEVKE